MAFIFKVQTSGSDDTFTLPIYNGGTYDCVVDWGDGEPTSAITAWDDADKTHTYATEDLYTISITGTLYGWSFNNGGDCAMMRDVTDWGAGVFRMGAGSPGGHFYGCTGLTSSATNAPDITGTTNFTTSFRGCSSLNSLDLENWDVSSVTTFSYAWYNCSSLTSLGDLSNWDVSSVETFYAAWYNCSSLTSLDLSNWDVSSVTTFRYAWYNCSLTSLGDLSNWDVSSVETFYDAWRSCSSLTSLGDLSNWDVSSVTNFYYTWYNCSSLTSLGNLSNWDVSSVTTFSYAWRGCSSLTSLGDLSNWDVSSVTNFSSAWENANNALTDENYSKMLIAWSKLTLQAGTDAHFGDAKYLKGAPTAARAIIDATWGTITDGGQSTVKFPSQPDYIKSVIVRRNITWNKKYIDDAWGFLTDVIIAGTTCWGHSTGVLETNTRTFTGNWTGTGEITGSGDSEQIELQSGQYMESEVDNTGAVDVELAINVYASGDTVTLKYRTSATSTMSGDWNTYSGSFTSLGYVQARVEVA